MCDNADALEVRVRRDEAADLVREPLPAAVDAGPRREALVRGARVQQRVGGDFGRQAAAQLLGEEAPVGRGAAEAVDHHDQVRGALWALLLRGRGSCRSVGGGTSAGI